MLRRHFLKRTSLGSIMLASGVLPNRIFTAPEITKITILHTNDVHSRIDPFPINGSWSSGQGGAARRASLIQQIRSKEEHVLLLDAGDIFQGTPYFNFFGGELEFKLMSMMQYDVATLGNHDFDAGLDGFLKQRPLAKFPFINCNYDFSETILHDQIEPYTIFEKGGIKIGVLGVGIELKGLVPKELYGKTKYLNPIKNANQIAKKLKTDHKCDYIICLSHLGFKYDDGTVDDQSLAKESENIDLIIGGHTHTFLKEPVIVKNKNAQPVLINQVGWAGLLLGKIEVYFERNKKGTCTTCKNEWIQ